VLTVACVLAGTVSGFSVLISAAGMSYIRAWNRISVVVAFLALLAVGCIIERLLDRVDGTEAAAASEAGATGLHATASATASSVRRLTGAGRAVSVLVAVGLLGVGYVDQTGRSDMPQYAAVHQQAETNRQFFGSVATTVGPGGAVFTWPYVGFPEVPDRGGTGAYDQAIGYVYQPDLKWSYGFARGRHPDYPLAFESQPASQWLTSVVAIGFGALVVDRAALTGKSAVVDVEPDVQRVLGQPKNLSADGRYALYDLMPFAAKVHAEKSPGELAAIAAKALAEPATEELKALAAKALAGS
jgi:phosphoglycerol transferase